MLAYQHAYHAGNIADVHKHLVLFALGQRLVAKSSAITWADTHAGRGLYPLTGAETQRGGEYREGILPLWQQRGSFPQQSLIHNWLRHLERLNVNGELQCYAGSPWWLGQLMRKQDRLELYELHPGEHRHLDDQQDELPPAARRHFADGPATLIKHLPVSTPRLCVLIDPSYEIKADYQQVAEDVKRIAHKVRHAVVAVWYPLLPQGRHTALLEAFRDSGLNKLLYTELCYRNPNQQHGMYGSGMLVFNPPWQLDQQLDELMAQLAAVYQGEYSVRWLVGE